MAEDEEAEMSTATEIEKAVERIPALGDAGERVARAIHDAVKRSPEAREAADALHGTWLGHPLHPVLTDFAIGAWAMGGVFDLVGELDDSPSARRAGDTLAAIGTALAVPTALSGMADFSTVPRPATTTATLHGLLNAGALGLYALSLRERSQGTRGRGLAFSASALGLLLASSWLGGELVYKHRVGVDQRERFGGPGDWTPVLPEAKLADREPTRVDVDGKAVMLYREDDAVYAIAAVCGHAGGPLEEGDVHECHVHCPWHDSTFDLRDGSVVHGPATRPQTSFRARIRDGQVEIRMNG